jgi:hypothetical protein
MAGCGSIALECVTGGEGRIMETQPPQPIRFQFSVRTVMIATAIVAVDSALVARAGSVAMIWLVIALAALSLGTGGAVLCEAIFHSRHNSQSTLLDQFVRAGAGMMGACSAMLLVLGIVTMFWINLITLLSPLFNGIVPNDFGPSG